MRRIVAAVLSSAVLTCCQTLPRDGTGSAGENPVVETHAEMVGAINPAALAISDVTDSARSETEGLDPALMDDAAWGKLARAARALELSSRRMAGATTLRVGAHTAEEPGFANRTEIQAKLDANPKLFRALSARLADDAGDLAAAVAARKLRRTRDLAQSLSGGCETCHTLYWRKPAS